MVGPYTLTSLILIDFLFHSTLSTFSLDRRRRLLPTPLKGSLYWSYNRSHVETRIRDEPYLMVISSYGEVTADVFKTLDVVNNVVGELCIVCLSEEVGTLVVGTIVL